MQDQAPHSGDTPPLVGDKRKKLPASAHKHTATQKIQPRVSEAPGAYGLCFDFVEQCLARIQLLLAAGVHALHAILCVELPDELSARQLLVAALTLALHALLLLRRFLQDAAHTAFLLLDCLVIDILYTTGLCTTVT